MMLDVRRAADLSEPGLAPYLTMRRVEEHRRRGIFVAEGEPVVRRLLASGLGVESMLLPEGRLAEFDSLAAGRGETLITYVLPKRELERLTGFTFFQGVLAVGRVPEETPPEAMLAAPRPLLAAADGLTGADNVGALVRSCVALGVDGLLVGGTCCHPYLRRAVRASMGTVFRLPFCVVEDLGAGLERLRAAGVRCYAAHPRPGAVPAERADFRGPVCVAFGAEGPGLSEAVAAACDAAVTVPMAAGVDSLNVAAAAAAILYEAGRQRRSV